MGHATGTHRLVDLEKVLDKTLDEHIVLAKTTLKVDHLVQDFLVVGLHVSQPLGDIVVGTGKMVNLGLKAFDGTGVLDSGTLCSGGYV